MSSDRDLELIRHITENLIEAIDSSLWPRIEKKMEETAKLTAKEAVWACTGESLDDQNGMKAVRDGVRWSIKSSQKTTLVSNAILTSFSAAIGSGLTALIFKLKGIL